MVASLIAKMGKDELNQLKAVGMDVARAAIPTAEQQAAKEQLEENLARQEAGTLGELTAEEMEALLGTKAVGEKRTEDTASLMAAIGSGQEDRTAGADLARQGAILEQQQRDQEKFDRSKQAAEAAKEDERLDEIEADRAVVSKRQDELKEVVFGQEGLFAAMGASEGGMGGKSGVNIPEGMPSDIGKLIEGMDPEDIQAALALFA